jgi:hypothetical protein
MKLLFDQNLSFSVDGLFEIKRITPGQNLDNLLGHSWMLLFELLGRQLPHLLQIDQREQRSSSMLAEMICQPLVVSAWRSALSPSSPKSDCLDELRGA